MTARQEFHQIKGDLFRSVTTILSHYDDDELRTIELNTGVRKDTLKQWLNGSTRTPKDGSLTKVAQHLRLPLPTVFKPVELVNNEPVALDPHKHKYHGLYWSMADSAANQSVATRHKVGAVLVTKTGMISPGWNGMPPGLPNECESSYVSDPSVPGGKRPKTNPEVLHAERNAIDKMTRQGIPTDGAMLFITRAPCLECAKTLCTLGLKEIWFSERHDDMRGVALLKRMGVPVHQKNDLKHLQQSLALPMKEVTH